MCAVNNLYWDIKDTIQVTISVLLTVITYLVIFFLKPRLKIVCACLKMDEKKIKIKVENHSWLSSAVNIRIEVCALDPQNNYTYHLKVDHIEFLIMPPKKKNTDNEKVFKVIGIHESAREYTAGNTELEKYNRLLNELKLNKLQLRVRLHSYQGFSGFGKAEEKIFKL